MEEEFRTNYKGMVIDDFDDDYSTFKSIKRTTNSYIKNPNTDKLHSIYNRIYILKRLFHETFLYEYLVKNNDTKDGKNLVGYFLTEAFGCTEMFDEDKIDDLWVIQISDLLENTKIDSKE